ncbi:MAG: DnaJ domain-containing protein [Candidatus Acidiferrales bacterium]
MQGKPHTPRKHPRLKLAKELHVVWKCSGRQAVSRAQSISLGGIFLYTRNALATDSTIEVAIDLCGRVVRARGTIRYFTTGKGVGVQFVHMTPGDRAKLDQFLSKHAAESDKGEYQNHAVSRPGEQKEEITFDAELRRLLDVARDGTHYQLLGATSEMTASQIKQKYYALARKFHPDHHMEKEGLLGSLKELMDMLTVAYKTLTDQGKRALYDKQLEKSGGFALRRKTESQKITENSLNRAKQCIRAGNFVGSIVWLQKCVEMVPEDASYHAMLARSLGTIAQYRNDAIAHYQKAIELDPWKLEPYFELAELYEEMELLSRALSTYSKILELNPVHAKARQRHSAILSTPSSR